MRPAICSAIQNDPTSALNWLSQDGLLVCEVGEAEQALVHLLPELPLAWVEFKVGQMGIFVAECADLVAHHASIARLAAAREPRRTPPGDLF